MINKSKFILFLLTLYSTSAAFAMDGDRENQRAKTSKASVTKKRTVAEIKRTRKDSFNRVLSLFEDQAQHHQHMYELLTQQTEKLTQSQTDEEFNKIVLSVIGLSSDKVLCRVGTENSVPIGTAFEKIAIRHQREAKQFKNIFESRTNKFVQNEDTLFSQLAAMYLGAIENFNDTQDKLLEQKTKLTPHHSDEEISALYSIKIDKNKSDFYQLVQKKIIEEFKINEKKIFENLSELCKFTLKNDNKPTLDAYQELMVAKFIQDHNIPSDELQTRSALEVNFKTSPKNIQFCQDVVSGRYHQFASLEVFEELALAFDNEEEQMNDAVPTTMTTTATLTTTFGVNYEKNKKKRERKKRAQQAQQNTFSTLSTGPIIISTDISSETNVLENRAQENIFSTLSTWPIINTTDIFPQSNVLDNRTQQNTVTTSHAENISSTEIFPKESILSGLGEPDPDNQNTDASSFVQNETAEENSIVPDLEKLYEQDRQVKKRQRKKVVSSALSNSPPIAFSGSYRLGLSSKKHEFLTNILAHPVNLNLRWKRIVNLFNSPTGFKGKVYGGSDGSSNTFEVFFRFQNGQITGFLPEKNFQILKEDAEPESREARNFLPENKRLQSYRLNSEESIGTSFFTLHNPHPCPFAYRDLVERLQMQLRLLNIT